MEDSVTVTVTVTREDPIPGAGPDYWAPSTWRAAVYDPADVDGPPVSQAWSTVGPDDAMARALARVTLAGVLGGAEGAEKRGHPRDLPPDELRRRMANALRGGF